MARVLPLESSESADADGLSYLGDKFTYRQADGSYNVSLAILVSMIGN